MGDLPREVSVAYKVNSYLLHCDANPAPALRTRGVRRPVRNWSFDLSSECPARTEGTVQRDGLSGSQLCLRCLPVTQHSAKQGGCSARELVGVKNSADRFMKLDNYQNLELARHNMKVSEAERTQGNRERTAGA